MRLAAGNEHVGTTVGRGRTLRGWVLGEHEARHELLEALVPEILQVALGYLPSHHR